MAIRKCPKPSTEGENLVFPAGKLHITDGIDDITDLTVSNLEIDAGYTISGSDKEINLIGNCQVTSGNSTFDPQIMLPQETTADITVADQAKLRLLSGVLTGVGGIQKDGAGTLQLFSPFNTYGGSTILRGHARGES